MFFQRLAQHILCLRHRTFVGVNQQQHAVHHGEHPFYFSAKVCMARRIQNIDFRSVMHNRSIFRQNCNTAFPLQVIGVHHAFRNLFVCAENVALLQHRIY